MLISVVFLAAASAYFGPAEFWGFLAVIVALATLVVGMLTSRKTHKQKSRSDSLDLYVHFVDDLQNELRRLQDMIIAERKETQEIIREKNVDIEKLNMRIEALRTPSPREGQ